MALHRFQGRYLTGLEHAYLAAFVVSIAAIILALFLPGWPGAYRRRTTADGMDARTSTLPIDRGEEVASSLG